ncbi:MAG: dihydropteroate synthase, partial [Actinomycetota bacterium]
MIPCGERTLVMGILNVTPDSFADGGRYASAAEAVSAGRRMVDDGAAILDVGGESTRPGSEPVPEDEELRRVVPVIEGLVAAGVGVPISVDTRRSGVARAALAAGACIVND